MTKRRLADRTIKALKPAQPGKRYEILDAVVPGFAVRVTDKGVRTYILKTRFPGSRNPTRRALGPVGSMTLEAAREKALTWLKMIKKGIDPAEAQREASLEALRSASNSFAAVAEAFILHVKRQRQRKAGSVEREIRLEFVSRWGARPVTSITAHDIVQVIDRAIARDAPYQAHNLLGHVRRLFNWAIARGVYGLEHSPCDRLRPKDVIGRRAMRFRTLSDDELRALWLSTNELGYPYGPLFRLLIVTIQRKSEVANALRSEIDFNRQLWTIPAGRMKGDAPHVVPLTPIAADLFASLPEFTGGDHLFSMTFGEKPVGGFSKAKGRLDELMLKNLREMAVSRGAAAAKVRLEPWVIHDIRRTGRTALSALPVPDLVRELVIAHAKPGLHKVYDQHAYLEEKRQALQLWAARLSAIVGVSGPGEPNAVAA